jgi:hypothetical protein
MRNHPIVLALRHGLAVSSSAWVTEVRAVRALVLLVESPCAC